MLIKNVNVATLQPDLGGAYGTIERAALHIEGEHISWIGAERDLPSDTNSRGPIIDGGGGWLTPGLINSHTHLVYAGSRAREFERRLEGVSYEQLSREGGGIRSSMRATRAADVDALLAVSRPRLRALMREGVTTIEIKSGYGLDLETERRCLRVARLLGESPGVDVRATYLGAHALPPEFEGRADDYIAFVCEEVLPALAAEGLVDAVDAFCEGIGFDIAQTERVFNAAARLNIPVKLHAEQLSNLGGAALAARHGALSADHLEHLDDAGIEAMAAAGTVAVLLPGAFYFLRETRLPPIDRLRAAGVPIALATDLNPGSSPLCSLLLMLNMACTLFRMTPAEALAGVTRHAAAALGLDDRGELRPGARADLALWAIEHPAELAYQFGVNPCSVVIKDGAIVLDNREESAS